ncbi:Sec-independent protein translocase subunit TatA [Trujillonella endophytica]|uniref:Sec-independent protein translocase protein TatA n=1 Tax=Trujillonella endophytica TaxID=673521 RepID=A0A1H8T3V6_9ACTN|nr:Sec-independent protein translocase subunit TatA [Trujillella endophytica]SEO85495.1 sec-independent protein translocase protein TatA [Trujillella endophytica]
MNLGPLEIGLIILAVLLLFGYKKLPDASRSLGRSLRIFKGEMKGMKDDDRAADVRSKEPAQTSAPLRGEVIPPAAPLGDPVAEARAAQLEAEARAAEAQAAALRARAAQAAASGDTPR